jgi:hypothetical protein
MSDDVGALSGGRGQPALATTRFDLSEIGYTQDELWLAGKASAYQLVGTGWEVEQAGSAPFRTRLLVCRPAEAARFNGTVMVEWLNVSGGLDSASGWVNLHRQLARDGAAWVGVSAQAVGVEGGPTILGQEAIAPLKKVDPDRYGSLEHPGDAYSYDIFSRAGRAARQIGLDVERLIGFGQSQSAHRLVTYVNAIDRQDAVYDGFFVHSRPGGAAPLDDGAAISRAPIRDDVRVPVLVVQTETDLFVLGYLADRQPDGARLRVWEIAGSAHADTYVLVAGPLDNGRLAPAELAARLQATSEPLGMPCQRPINSGPQQHYVLNAGWSHLDCWIAGGDPPPSAGPLEIAGSAFAVDDYGNARGGVRSPWVDVPVAVLSGLGQEGGSFGMLFGTTTPLSPPSHYLDRFGAALRDAVKAGFILDADGPEILGMAADVAAGAEHP